MWPKDYVPHEHDSVEPTEAETQTLQVKWTNGSPRTKLLTVTDVNTSEDLVEFWFEDKLLLMVRASWILEVVDIDEIELSD